MDMTLIQVHREEKQTKPFSLSHLGIRSITDNMTQRTSQSRIMLSHSRILALSSCST